MNIKENKLLFYMQQIQTFKNTEGDQPQPQYYWHGKIDGFIYITPITCTDQSNWWTRIHYWMDDFWKFAQFHGNSSNKFEKLIKFQVPYKNAYYETNPYNTLHGLW